MTRDGTLLAGSSFTDLGVTVAVTWTAVAGLVSLGSLASGDPGNTARASSADGGVIVGNAFRPPAGDLAWRWTAASGMVPLASSGATPYTATVEDVSADGSHVVGSLRWTEAGGTEGFLWIDALGFRSTGASLLRAISGDGGYAVGADGLDPVRLALSADVATVQRIPLTATGVSGAAYGVSSDGGVVVGTIDTDGASQPEWAGSEAFRWSEAGGTQLLGRLPGDAAAHAFDVSADGAVIVGDSRPVSPPGSGRAVLWRADCGLVDLTDAAAVQGVDLRGERLGSATAVSADGRLVAGTTEGGQGYLLALQ